jgi:hypothetical protein
VETDAAVEITTPISTAAWKVNSTFHRFHRPIAGHPNNRPEANETVAATSLS